jgi:hypothetical protein
MHDNWLVRWLLTVHLSILQVVIFDIFIIKKNDEVVTVCLALLAFNGYH